ncbi:unnamed protein product [Blumeria hordei]|uniref:Putative 5'-nucleotidase C-terminal domain-containing protein n=1 Tax=Blumeria hordei TaxID=2867405 RepID=A0A383UQD4_BLUHO|nr:unnamed protein product [Blumeria hordei]
MHGTILLKCTLILASSLSLALSEQPEAAKPVPAPVRSLPWGQLNFLQTTDTHGWHAGHLQESQYSADWGDYISFALRMHERADLLGVDLLLVDNGDRVEGNGLYDASIPKGLFTHDIIAQQDIDILTIGNHELYQQETATAEYREIVPRFEGKYLASNVDYIDPETGLQVPFAKRYRIFTTKNLGIRVLAFGFLFDFNGNANNTIVQPVKAAIDTNWFHEALMEEVDLFLIVGHIPLDGPEFGEIHRAIRNKHKDTPIQIFGGHSHIRNFVKFDSKSSGMQGGRYMETVGWLSIDGIKGGAHSSATQEITFQRKYIDNNILGYYHHTGLNVSTFHTDVGKNVSNYINQARKILDLGHIYGCAPQDLYLNRAPYHSDESLLTWLEKEVLPVIATTPERKAYPRIVLMNSGAIRFDIFKGAFTRDTSFILSPFVNQFRFIKNVPYEAAKKIPTMLNNVDYISSIAANKSLGILEQAPITTEHVAAKLDFEGSIDQENQKPFNYDPNNLKILPGYTTTDQAGFEGDDTVHSPINTYPTPNCIYSFINPAGDAHVETVDLIFFDFIQDYVLSSLNQINLFYSGSDVEVYREETFLYLVNNWIEENWAQNC